MTDLQIRRIPFEFDGDVPFQWNPENPAFAILANAVAVLAIAFEKHIVTVMRQALPLITDPAVAEEADAFLRQEAQHARVHRLHWKALTRQHPGLQATVDTAVASFDHLVATKPLEFNLAYIASLEATFTPIFKLMLDNEANLFRPGDDRVASMFVWHFVEEVEHRSSALIVYRSVVNDERYRLRKVPEIFGHVFSIYAGAVRSFNEALPLSVRGIDAGLAAPSAMWKREVMARMPVLRKRIEASGVPAVFAPATSTQLLKLYVNLLRSQAPGHDPAHAATPALAGDWFARYDAGADVTRWFERAQVGSATA